MSSRDHYVSQFHLRGFTDPAATRPQEPWLWVGDCATQSVTRRAPKNVAWSTDLFAGPGGLADREASIEAYLATHVEGPAAFALRGVRLSATGKAFGCTGRNRALLGLGRRADCLDETALPSLDRRPS